MRYYLFPHEELSDDLRTALTRGLGLPAQDVEACARHCARYGVDDVAAFVEELEVAQAALVTAKALSAPILVDWRGRLCYDVPPAPDRGGREDEEEGWMDDKWLADLLTRKSLDPSLESAPRRAA